MSKESTRARMTEKWLFGEFELADELRRCGAPVELTPKALALLHLLVRQAGAVVSKREIWDEVWPGVIVTDAALTVCMTEVRRALGDDARKPRYLATVARRGYRFIATVSLRDGPASLPGRDGEGPPIVGREAELEALGRALADVGSGQRRAVFIVGEPGIGKTTLLDAFRLHVGGTPRMLVVEGQCTEHFGPSEPYFPLLDGLARACRGKNGDRVLQCLSLHAPLWLAQMPSVAERVRANGSDRELLPTTPERMVRELTDAVEALATDQIVVLCLEDLHWSDQATLDWLNLVIRRRLPARLLIVVTLRDMTFAGGNEFVRERLPDLLLHANARLLALNRLSEASVERYLEGRRVWADLILSEEKLERFARLLHRRTGGNPLYLVSILETFTPPTGGSAYVDSMLDQLAQGGVPASLRQFLTLQMTHLTDEEKRLIEAASVVGDGFTSALVSAAIGEPDDNIERQCERLAQTRRIVQYVDATTLPDGTLASRYAFAHSLYREVAYERIPPGRRAQLHRLIGERLERAYGSLGATVASELAMHFGRGLAYCAAARHSLTAGRNALGRGAYGEAEGHFRSGLEYATTAQHSANACPPAIEWNLCVALGQTLLAVKGWASPEAEQAFARAHQLAVELTQAPPFLPLWGTAMGAVVRGDFVRYEQLGRQLRAHAESSGDGLQQAAAYWALGQGAFHRGDFHDAERLLEMALRGFDRIEHAAQVVQLGVNCQIFTLSYLSHVQWCLGNLDRAETLSRTALALSTDLDHAFSSALAIAYAATLNVLLGSVTAAAQLATQLSNWCHEKGFAYYLGWSRFVRGWCGGDYVADPLAEMSAGLASMRASGARLRLVFYQTLLAEGYARAQRMPEATLCLEAAHGEMARTRERCWEAELVRVSGTLASLTPNESQQQERYLTRAIAIARSQGALSWELRAILPLARLLAKDGRRAEGRKMVSDLYGRFSEGFEQIALQEAADLLSEMR
ncbi:MAG: AAA family ATPase [Gammaproteobacteria bacterium]|nr:AAA family ATPase [Gammaproteobacteria bacterium]